jgi:hypothetical protein
MILLTLFSARGWRSCRAWLSGMLHLQNASTQTKAAALRGVFDIVVRSQLASPFVLLNRR